MPAITGRRIRRIIRILRRVTPYRTHPDDLGNPARGTFRTRGAAGKRVPDAAGREGFTTPVEPRQTADAPYRFGAR
ncbi:hypothetical protein SSP531S_27520 [Streptomyces spongiicola]|uniref:Uncharacterized protein n=1 Tax=Streptomyces spongiicola TaxID=1690221 RepID=A0A388SXQ3_9ACTN|nr:hypothetical protein SSP531S_27520 [Streptomyces spongiicola]